MRMRDTPHDCKMAAPAEYLNDAVLEENLVDFRPDYPCLYDVRSPDFTNREKRDLAVEEIAEKLQTTGEINSKRGRGTF